MGGGFAHGLGGVGHGGGFAHGDGGLVMAWRGASVMAGAAAATASPGRY
jgi:hypothetical protein